MSFYMKAAPHFCLSLMILGKGHLFTAPLTNGLRDKTLHKTRILIPRLPVLLSSMLIQSSVIGFDSLNRQFSEC